MPRRSKGEYTAEVLDRCPGRVTRFLSALAAVPEILTILCTEAGLTENDLDEGRQLLLACLTSPYEKAASEARPGSAGAAREAWVLLEAWQKPHMIRYSGALRRRFPDVAEHLFQGLGASKRGEAVLTVSLFLDRMDALKKSRPRGITAKDSREALDLLASRGLAQQERDRLRALVAAAKSLSEPQRDLDPPPEIAAEARKKALIALKKWEEEWFGAAHIVVKKRKHLIRLGLSARKPPAKKKSRPE